MKVSICLIQIYAMTLFYYVSFAVKSLRSVNEIC